MRSFGVSIIGSAFILVLAFIRNGQAITVDDLYSYYNEASDLLPLGDDKFDFVKLKTPMHFYSSTYNHIYINTNGILTFGTEFPDFLNIPFPIEYPAIAPFYSNVDISAKNDTAAIAFFTSQDDDLLHRASETVRNGFEDAADFEAQSIFVATWENVGRYLEKTDLKNTFQAVIICNDDETYVQFLYPKSSLNWIQADVGESGLRDVRAQAGFVSEDGRFHMLKGSGTDYVRYLSQLSNSGNEGEWLFRVGPLEYDENVQEPRTTDGDHEDNYVPRSCRDRGHLKCHTASYCTDTNNGFYCVCPDGFYGNGLSCIKNDVPLRVAGTISGTLNNRTFSTPIQSYAVMADGRTYTAINPIESDIGTRMQVLQVLGSVIGWLFAKPASSESWQQRVKNGYDLTGGEFNQTATVRIGHHVIYIAQHFTGLNVWDQLAMTIEVTGSVPDIPVGTKLQMENYLNEYNFVSDTTMRSVSERKLINRQTGEEMIMSVDQNIEFRRSKLFDYPAIDRSVIIREKVLKINLDYEENVAALRIAMMNKIGVSEDTNPCNDGTANCGANTFCVPADDSYECQCNPGYTFAAIDGDDEYCVDVDECRSSNVCDEHADCLNTLGGYDCRCHPGYHGNGVVCERLDRGDRVPPALIPQRVSTPPPALSTEYQSSEITTQESADTSDPCANCSDKEVCINGGCTCKQGYYSSSSGDDCVPICGPDFVWNGEKCISAASEDDEVPPYCTLRGCTCQTGYKLVGAEYRPTCVRLTDDNPDNTKWQASCEIEANCNINANCEWVEYSNKYDCVCNPGFDGDGYDCIEKEISCAEEDICDVHATCLYNQTLGRSICVCERGFEGDGRVCVLGPDCHIDDDCGVNSFCDAGVCVCQPGYERDLSDFCVKPGFCGGVYCADNAVCMWDSRQKVLYCQCPEGFVGDGVHSCKSIPPPCNVRNNCGLHASCKLTHSSYECICDSGFLGDGFVCLAEKNCINIPSLCHPNADCVQTTSGLQCVCNHGFIGNGSHCSEPPRHDTGYLFISQGVATVRLRVGGGAERPISIGQMVIGIDKDCAEGRIYWSDITAKAIVSSKYDGTDLKTFINESIASPEGISIDWISRRLYWTDSSKDTIEVASLDNPKLRAVLVRKNLVNPRGIAVDPYQKKLYWSDWNRAAPKIEWSNLDGTERQTLLTKPFVNLPNSLAISPRSRELCFADAGTQKIECIDTHSRSVHTIAANLSYPFGLAITNDHYYWTDWTTKKIESMDLDGQRKPSIMVSLFGNHKMFGITASLDSCQLYPSQCQINNGDCPSDRICLVNPRSPSGRSCKCTNIHNCNEILDVD